MISLVVVAVAFVIHDSELVIIHGSMCWLSPWFSGGADFARKALATRNATRNSDHEFYPAGDANDTTHVRVSGHQLLSVYFGAQKSTECSG